MTYLADTSVFVRMANAADAQHEAALGAVAEPHRHGETIVVTPPMPKQVSRKAAKAQRVDTAATAVRSDLRSMGLNSLPQPFAPSRLCARPESQGPAPAGRFPEHLRNSDGGWLAASAKTQGF